MLPLLAAARARLLRRPQRVRDVEWRLHAIVAQRGHARLEARLEGVVVVVDDLLKLALPSERLVALRAAHAAADAAPVAHKVRSGQWH